MEFVVCMTGNRIFKAWWHQFLIPVQHLDGRTCGTRRPYHTMQYDFTLTLVKVFIMIGVQASSLACRT